MTKLFLNLYDKEDEKEYNKEILPTKFGNLITIIYLITQSIIYLILTGNYLDNTTSPFLPYFYVFLTIGLINIVLAAVTVSINQSLIQKIISSSIQRLTKVFLEYGWDFKIKQTLMQ